MVTKDSLSQTGLEIFQAIDAYKVGDDLRDTITSKLSGEYNKLRTIIFDWRNDPVATFSETDIKQCLEDIEIIWVSERYEDDPKYKHKDGRWKLRTLLPKGYSSAKSVLLSAVACGVLDNVSGKSELERKIKEAKKAEAILPIDMKVDAVIGQFELALNKLIGNPPDPLTLGMVMGQLGNLQSRYDAVATMLYATTVGSTLGTT